MLFPKFNGLAGFLAAGSRLALVLSGRHSAEVSRERHCFIIQRAQLVAGLLSLLTVGWIAIDLLTITWPLSGALTIARLAAALAFGMLAKESFVGTRREAYWALGSLMGTAIVFSFVANIAFWWFAPRHRYSSPTPISMRHFCLLRASASSRSPFLSAPS